MRYPGAKNRIYQQIINLMPPHRVYVETHLGSGAILRNKLPSEEQHGIDPDPCVLRYFDQSCRFFFHQKRAEEFLREFQFRGDELIYSDPPYPLSCRRRSRIYRHDYTEKDHQELLGILKALPCRIMISTYPNPLYQDELVGWFPHTFTVPSQTGLRIEVVWTNFKPGALHDTRYLGRNFTERQAIKRKLQRWQRRLLGESPQFQQAFATMCLQSMSQNRTESAET
jgi:site-specific DNA-adenine methylase